MATSCLAAGKLWEHSVCPDMHKVKACSVICRLWDKVR